MGYYTLHKIRIINQYNTKKNLDILLEKISEIANYDFIIVGNVIIDTNYNGGCGSKWYDFRRDMFKISEELPELEIKVNGKGEDEGDIWEYIYKDGEEWGGYCDSFSDIDEEPHFEEENENNQLSYNNGEMSEDIAEEFEMGNIGNILGIEEEFQDIKIEDDLKYRR